MTDYAPTTVNLHVTRACDNHCEFCTGRGLSPVPDMTPAVVAKVAETFPTIGSACIAGLGEPLLSPQLPGVVAEALKHWQFISLITNGHDVRKVGPSVPWAALGYVNVSVNEIDPWLYAQRCGSSADAFAAMQGSIAYLLSRNVHLVASFVVGASVAQRVPAWLSWCAVSGIRYVSLMNTLPHPSGPTVSWRKEVLDESFVGLIDEWRSRAAMLGVHVLHWPVLVGQDPTHAPAKCHGPFQSLSVDGAGNVSGCPRILAPRAAFGNLREGAACYGSEHFAQLRAQMRAGGLREGGLCQACFGAWA